MPDPTIDRPFEAPWQADLFGLTVALSQAGAFSWPDWTRTFGAELARGTDYWPAWLAALETIAQDRGLAQAEQIADLAAHWQRAARATPHGQPIRLQNAP